MEHTLLPQPDDEHDDHGGLHRDLPALLGRRDALKWMAGMSLAGLLAACRVGGESSPTSAPISASVSASDSSAAPVSQATTTPTTGATTTAVAGSDTTATTALAELIGVEIPDETAGPFPADGTNGPNVLTEDGVLKRDITTSFGSLSGTAEGIPTVLELRIVDNETGSPLSGAVVYLWHCTADGRYSIYEIADQNYLRGVQVADDAGRVSFDTIFPGCYPGRWPHCHFEVYDSLDEASVGRSATKTSQVAFPQADCEVVYADGRYGSSLGNLAQLSLETDGVFRDGWKEQLATVAGSVDGGYTAALLVRV